MKRASFTVKTKDGIARDANHLAITISPCSKSGGYGSISVLSFVCSGGQMAIPVDEIAEIAFHPAGAGWCSECDQSIHQIVGASINANDPPPAPKEID